MNKRIITLILALCLICSMVPVPVSAASVIASGACGKNLRWQLNENGLLTISGTGAMTDFDFYDYEKDTAPWVNYSNQIESVVVNSGVTSIGEDAFWYCENLKTIELSDTVISLGDFSIYGCDMLTSVKFGKNLTNIGPYVFDWCDNLNVIEIDPENPNFCTDESSVIFNLEKTTIVRAPTGLTGKYTLPDSVIQIGNNAFMHCEKLTDVVMQDGITTIGSGAFTGCSALISVEIPDGVTQIGSGAFSGCNISTVSIPVTVNVISRDAFYLCENIIDVYYSGTKSEWATIEVYRDNECLTQAPYIHYSVSDSINHWRSTEVSCGGRRYVCEKCDCGYMRDENGEKIEDRHVFDREIATEEYLKTPATCTDSAVYYKSCECGNKGEETFTSGSIDPYNHLFFNGECFRCDIKGGTCGDSLFWSLDSTGLLSIWGTGAMGNYSEVPWFEMKDNVVRVVIDQGVTTVGVSAFSGCENLGYVSLPDGISLLGSYAFYGCSSLEEVSIPDTVTNIGSAAFQGCSSLTCISVPNGITEINGNFVAGCSSLTTILIPESVTTIKSGAFDGCTNLSSIDIPDGVTNIGYYAFHDCVSLTNITLPSNLEKIDNYTFMGCTGLTTITIPDKVASIGDLAFHYCKGLTSIVIPSNVTTIKNNAFAACTNILDIYYGGTATEWSELGENIPTATYIHYNCTHPDNHWTSTIIDATCEEGGYSYECCNCGYRRNDCTIPALGHDWNGTYCQRCDATRTNPFADVPEDSFYYDPVLWAVENGITNGATPTTFNPNGTCLRAHVVTFLHRAAGNPEPTSTNNPFTDVKSGDFFYNPVLWAVENGITNGTSATTFGSYANCNRAAVVTFLWRSAGSPEPKSTNNPFVDVKTTDFFYKPVLWAVENGITNGVDATHFGPVTDCNRAQVVTFLYRARDLLDNTPSNPIVPTPPTEPEEPADPGVNVPPSDPNGTVYILNLSTMKFHYPSCYSVEQINEENYYEYLGTREALISYGYDPCGRCDP